MSERRKFCYAAKEFGVESFRAEFFEIARKDGLSGEGGFLQGRASSMKSWPAMKGAADLE